MRRRAFAFVLGSTAAAVMLTAAEDVDRWLEGTPEEALELQKPANGSAIVLMPPREKAEWSNT